MSDVIVLADSLNVATGHRLVSVLLTRFPYTLIQELATHRLLFQGGVVEVLGGTNPFTRQSSRSSASTRAIPVERIIQRIIDDPFIPQFSRHQKGMQGIEVEDAAFQAENERVWRAAMEQNIALARQLAAQGVHKQHVNDLLKPFLRIPILITATEWENFFRLRTDKPCRPEFRAWAIAMQQALQASRPCQLEPGEWHMPFADRLPEGLSPKEQLLVVAARCARLSYANHNGQMDSASDLRLAYQLLRDGHMSPFEHLAMAVAQTDVEFSQLSYLPGIPGRFYTRNLRGFLSLRSQLEDGLIVF